MCWNSKRHNDHNYFAISGHSASQKYVTSPSVASKSIQNLLMKTIIVILSPHDRPPQEKRGKGGGDHERAEEPEAVAVVRGV